LKVFFIHCTRSNDYSWGCGNGFFVHSAIWLDSYHNRLGKKKQGTLPLTPLLSPSVLIIRKTAPLPKDNQTQSSEKKCNDYLLSIYFKIPTLLEVFIQSFWMRAHLLLMANTFPSSWRKAYLAASQRETLVM
jgi:hypothetical protein